MIYNGKFVQVDVDAAAKTQTQINQNNFLQQDIKSEIPKPKSVVTGEMDGIGLEYGFSSFTGSQSQPFDKKQTYDVFGEMARMEFINKALTIIAADATKKNSEENVFKIYSENEEIKEKLYDLFFTRLDFNNELYNLVFETLKMGDNFYEVIPDDYNKPSKIIYIRYLDPRKVSRIEINGRLSHFEYTIENEKDAKMANNSDVKDIVYKLQPWQIIHFKIPDKESEPYGGSLLKPGISTYRKLSLLEDIVLVYTLSRAPERRVFYIDVGNMNKTDAQRYMQRISDEYRSKPLIDENGNYNKRANILSITSDIFVPTRPEGNNSTKIDTLQAGAGLAGVDEFLKYFKNKILKVMNIPAHYLDDEADRSHGSASNSDIMFSNFIQRLQQHIVIGINKICSLELLFAGFKKEQLTNFNVRMTNPSNIAEVSDIEIMNQRIGLLQSIQGLNLFSNKWMLKNVLKLSDKEINDEMLNKQLEIQQQQANPAEMGVGGMGAGGMGAGGMMPPMEPGMGGMEAGMPQFDQNGMPITPGMPTPIPGQEEQQVAGTFINMFGKDFLVENRDDFLRLVKEAKKYENQPSKPIPLIEMAAAFIANPTRRPEYIKETTQDLEKQFILNEIGGFEFTKEGIIFERYDFDEENGGSSEDLIECEIIAYQDGEFLNE